jgi:hypothetical protein
MKHAPLGRCITLCTIAIIGTLALGGRVDADEPVSFGSNPDAFRGLETIEDLTELTTDEPADEQASPPASTVEEPPPGARHDQPPVALRPDPQPTTFAGLRAQGRAPSTPSALPATGVTALAASGSASAPRVAATLMVGGLGVLAAGAIVRGRDRTI